MTDLLAASDTFLILYSLPNSIRGKYHYHRFYAFILISDYKLLESGTLIASYLMSLFNEYDVVIEGLAVYILPWGFGRKRCLTEIVDCSEWGITEV